MRKVLVLAVSLLTLTETASAQKPQTRQGFTAAVGLGYGSAAVSCTGCPSDREAGAGVRLLFGGAIKPNLILAGEIEGWSKEDSGYTATLAWGSFVAQWYPNVASGFFVKGGVGVSGFNVEVGGLGVAVAKLETSGPGLVAGTGYDIRVAKNFSLTPYASVLFAAKAEAKVNGNETGAKLGGNLLHIGLAATWH